MDKSKRPMPQQCLFKPSACKDHLTIHEKKLLRRNSPMLASTGVEFASPKFRTRGENRRSFRKHGRKEARVDRKRRASRLQKQVKNNY
eukprot:2487933-Pleurochrysis_carterae.AAC.1